MVALAAAVRLSNAFTYHLLQGYDGFGHFTYIWYVAQTWRVPLSTSGWSFFHPPLYYFVMALIWKALSGIDPFVRLHIGMAFMGLLSLIHAWVCYVIVRRYFPGDRLIHLLAVGLMLFVPVHLYGAAFIGNEGLGAVFCSVSILALLAALERPSASRGAVLGLCLGLAMLTKFTGLVVVVGAFGALILQSALRRTARAGVQTVGACAFVMLAVCGWYYARNIALYGTPFKLSRDEFMVRLVENVQSKGKRTLLEYITFDPLILAHPEFPRTVPLYGPIPAGTERGPIPESVWTGIYANAWFDGFGGWAVRPIARSRGSLIAGRVLLSLGLLPTFLIVWGGMTAMIRLWRRGWDDTLVAMLFISGAMLATFIQGTQAVPTHAALKATYFMPMTVVFSFWFAHGLKSLGKSRILALLVAAEGAALAGVSVLMFTQGLILDGPIDPRFGLEGWENLDGTIYYAGGDRVTARRLFASSARKHYHPALENLAALDYEEGRLPQAIQSLDEANRVLGSQVYGFKIDVQREVNMTRAEYLNSEAVIFHAMGALDKALAAARSAVSVKPDFPEPYYNLGVLELLQAIDHDATDAEAKRKLVQEASEHLAAAVQLDSGFVPAAGALGVSQALLGDCRTAAPRLKWALHPPPGTRREFPVETGRGDTSVSIGRRKLIAQLPEELQPDHHLRLCEQPVPRSVLLVTIDTLRADRLSCYGYTRARTPAIDRLAEQGVLFTTAYCDIPWTSGSMASVMTGLYGPGHGLQLPWQRLAASKVTMAEMLKEKGFATGAVVGSFPVDSVFGLDQGFETYDDTFDTPTVDMLHKVQPVELVFSDDPKTMAGQMNKKMENDAYRSDDAVTAAATSWLERHAGARFFLWVHYFGPHERIHPGGGQRQRVIDDYDRDLANTDAAVGHLFEALDRLNLAASTLVVLHSDHGQSLGEHGLVGHGRDLYEADVRIPLIMRYPPKIAAGSRIATIVRNVDILPTVLESVGLKPPQHLAGRSLLPLIGGRILEPVSAFMEVRLTIGIPVSIAAAGEFFGSAMIQGVRQGRWKYIHTALRRSPCWRVPSGYERDDFGINPVPINPTPVKEEECESYAKEELYDVDSGRAGLALETENEADRHADLVAEIKGLVAEVATVRDTGEAFERTQEQREKLRSLGYLQ